jgi:ABC-type transporter Mla subunit MlaD
MNAMLSDHNVKAVSDALHSIEAAAAELPGTVTDTRRLLVELQSAADEMRSAAANVHRLTVDSGPELQLAIRRLRQAAESTATMTSRLDKLVADNQDSVSRFTDEGLTEIQELVRDMRQAAQSMERLGRQIEADPSQLLYQPATRGVEIPP